MKSIVEIVEAQRVFFETGQTRNVSFRINQLQKLRTAIKMYEKEILLALKADLNKPEFEAYGTEIGLVLDEAKFILSNLQTWAHPQRVKTSLVNFPSSSFICREPYGVTLIMSPWNYPVLLSLNPLLGALAAGNCVILKPSDYSKHVSRVLKNMLTDIFSEEYVAVIEGGREENGTLLGQKFDYIFFTGSVKVGKLVMEAAARHLTPVSLELGGKSPCIVDETADIRLAAKRIVWGKFLNGGQTCVAPDYLLVHERVKDELLEKMKQYILRFYGEEAQDNESYPRIVNPKHYKRLMELMNSGQAVTGGKGNPQSLRIAPTLLDKVNWQAAVMEEEIFGPILPILTFRSLKEAVEKVKQRPKPLAAYFFTRDKRREVYLLRHLSFGGGCINDTVMHLASSHMPFGGVGDSGMGGYHGRDSFETFSHRKSVLKKSGLIDIPLRYPPYKDCYLNIMKRILR